ncbi:transglutaminase [Aureimonas sp. SA4125]|uniref:transglutaminase family protein n=1 Tax=Aureimonas sp. SA4125 TaxID=2826993 RepID=UPI001CC5BA99|nr:transglutaminase family protein [Aureimonas sp. SA4125]BDA86259.1 transglutaminase [Aureimonas sp. SA4125]
MIYDVALKISYHYPSAVKDAHHILRIRPREDADQSVTAQSVKVVPTPDEAMPDRDFFSNAIDHIRLHQPHDALVVEMRARVSVASRFTDLGATMSLADIRAAALASRDSGATAPSHFLGASRLVTPMPFVAEYLRSGRSDRLGGCAILDMTKQVKADFAYTPGATRIDTPVEDVFRTRKGVCQDFAHLMIAGLRAAGLPSAYVSGFLRTDPPPGQARLAGRDAMHAWVKVWLGPETGWVGFDPTNGIAASASHIEVAVGRDYSDVAPVSGVLVTSGSQRMRHAVDVIPLDEIGD